MQALNKRAGVFSALDEQMLEIFAVHLGNSLTLARLHVSARLHSQTFAVPFHLTIHVMVHSGAILLIAPFALQHTGPRCIHAAQLSVIHLIP